MLTKILNNKYLQIAFIIVLLPLFCFLLSTVINFLLELGRIVGSNIHNISCLH